ncbi:MAG: hypothetical protein RR847_01315 [Bacilli bacterium]
MKKLTMLKDFGDIMNDPFFDEWFLIVEQIVTSREFQKRKIIKHHDDSVFTHCVDVSFAAFKFAKRCGASTRVCAIAGLLHDFYPEAWQYSESLQKLDESYRSRFLPTYKGSIANLHGFVHAKKAMINAYKYFPLLMDEIIADAILRHMFPLNLTPPRFLEGWLVTLADKKVSFSKMPRMCEWPKYVCLKREKF